MRTNWIVTEPFFDFRKFEQREKYTLIYLIDLSRKKKGWGEGVPVIRVIMTRKILEYFQT